MDTFQFIVLRGQKPRGCARPRSRDAEPPDDQNGCAVLAARSYQRRRVPGAVAGGLPAALLPPNSAFAVIAGYDVPSCVVERGAPAQRQ